LSAETNEAGGTITFDFADPVRLGHLGLMDIDEGGTDYIDVVTSEGLTHTIRILGKGENSVQKIYINLSHVVSVAVHFTNSGAITDIGVCFDCPPDCHIAEVDSSCSQGLFGIDNIVIKSYDSETVTFNLRSNKAELSHVQVWFDNAGLGDNADTCASATAVNVGDTIGTFTAKCTNNRALLRIAGGYESEYNQNIEVDSPDCQDNYEFIDFNPNKRCFWQISLPCSNTCDPNRKLQEKEGTMPCEIKSKLEGANAVKIDKCIAMQTDIEPVQIISQDTDTVTFAVHQVWKGCESGSSQLGWIATDFIAADGVLHCDRRSELSCGFAQEYTASCTGGKAVVDLYAYDEERGIFGQTDGSPLVVPTACDGGGDDATKMCHYRYVLECEALPCEDELGIQEHVSNAIADKQRDMEERKVQVKRNSFFGYFF